MKQLRITSSTPGFFGSINKALINPENVGEVVPLTKPKCRNAYIHGEAESKAGYDIPIFIDGEMDQMNEEVEKQDILLLLPDGEYPCKCTIEMDLTAEAYYFTLKDDWESLKR